MASVVKGLVDKVSGKLPGPAIPKDVEERIKRAKTQIKKDSTLRNECLEFWRGNQYVHRDKTGYLVKQGTVAGHATDAAHTMRMTFNVLAEPVEHEVAACTRRIPSYEVDPATADQDDIGAARLGEKVALFGYDKWRLLNVRQRCVSLAIVADEAFAWPYFDNTVGKPVGEDEDGNVVCEGEVRVRVFTGNEVGWEPGVPFWDSRYHVIEQARPVEEVENLSGYLGGKLTADGSASEVLGAANKQGEHNLVLVTEYLERPSIDKPLGRRLVIANGKVICKEEGYPCADADGGVVDEPILHYLPRTIDPELDRGLGLVRHAIDAVRVYNGCTNRALEWINAALNPQLIAKLGTLKTRPTNEPLAIIYYVGQEKPTWREVPAVPRELFQMRDEAQGFIRSLFSQNEIPSQVEAGRAIQALLERDENTRSGFVTRLAEWDSRLMRHCLYLVAKHYTEERTIKIRGRFGPETIKDFQGADLRSQCDIRVSPGSIEPRTKAAIEQKVMNWIQAGLITDKEEALRAMENGTAESLIEDYELDVSKAHRNIAKLVAMGMDAPGGDIPIADTFDNHAVHVNILSRWMKTQDWERQPEPVQEASKLLVEQHQMLEDQAQMKQAMQQNAVAEGNGMKNAAAPQTGAKSLASMPALPA